MTSTAVFIAALILLPALGLAVWVWSTLDRVEEDLRFLSGFEGKHFEIGHQAPSRTEGTR